MLRAEFTYMREVLGGTMPKLKPTGMMVNADDSIRHGSAMMLRLGKLSIQQSSLELGSALVGALSVMIAESENPDKSLDCLIEGLRVCSKRARELKAEWNVNPPKPRDADGKERLCVGCGEMTRASLDECDCCGWVTGVDPLSG